MKTCLCSLQDVNWKSIAFSIWRICGHLSKYSLIIRTYELNEDNIHSKAASTRFCGLYMMIIIMCSRQTLGQISLAALQILESDFEVDRWIVLLILA